MFLIWRLVKLCYTHVTLVSFQAEFNYLSQKHKALVTLNVIFWDEVTLQRTFLFSTKFQMHKSKLEMII